LKKLKNQCSKICEYSDFYNSTFHSVDSPNNYDKIDFKDFLLFTNIIKHIGYKLCEKCKPGNAQLAEIISKLEVKSENMTIKPLNNILKLKNNPGRFSNAIGNLLNTTFGKINKTDKDEIIQHLNSILA